MTSLSSIHFGEAIPLYRPHNTGHSGRGYACSMATADYSLLAYQYSKDPQVSDDLLKALGPQVDVHRSVDAYVRPIHPDHVSQRRRSSSTVEELRRYALAPGVSAGATIKGQFIDIQDNGDLPNPNGAFPAKALENRGGNRNFCAMLTDFEERAYDRIAKKLLKKAESGGFGEDLRNNDLWSTAWYMLRAAFLDYTFLSQHTPKHALLGKVDFYEPLSKDQDITAIINKHGSPYIVHELVEALEDKLGLTGKEYRQFDEVFPTKDMVLGSNMFGLLPTLRDPYGFKRILTEDGTRPPDDPINPLAKAYIERVCPPELRDALASTVIMIRLEALLALRPPELTDGTMGALSTALRELRSAAFSSQKPT